MWIDESGFQLQPVVRRTWAPRGQTPLEYSWDRHDRVSAVSALTLSPVRHRFGLYFQLHAANIHAPELIALLKAVHRHLGGKFILVWDRYVVHRQVARLFREAGIRWCEIEWLPGYAPDLDPVEMVWNHTKYADLANFLPENVDHLHEEVSRSIDRASKDQALLQSFFQYAHLPV